MFCSAKCLERSFKKYHRFECPVMPQLLKSGGIHMPLRQLFIALSCFGDSMESFREFFKESENRVTTVFDFDFRSENEETDKNLLLALRSLIRSDAVFDLDEHFAILENHPELGNVIKEHRGFIESFLQQQCQIFDLNLHGIFSGSSKKNENESKAFSSMQHAIGTGSLLFGSLSNHSCANNVFRIYVEGKVAYCVSRPIAKGSQIFDCYKASFVNQPKEIRQTKLLKEYKFLCDCEACIGNYPTPPNLPSKDFKLFKFAMKSNDEILNLMPSQAMKRYRECCKLLDKFNHNFPCMELCVLQKCIATFLLKQSLPSTLIP